MEHFYTHLQQVLETVDFHDPANPRQLLPRLRRLFGRIRPDQMEMNILRGILSHIEAHLPPGLGQPPPAPRAPQAPVKETE